MATDTGGKGGASQVMAGAAGTLTSGGASATSGGLGAGGASSQTGATSSAGAGGAAGSTSLGFEPLYLVWRATDSSSNISQARIDIVNQGTGSVVNTKFVTVSSPLVPNGLLDFEALKDGTFLMLLGNSNDFTLWMLNSNFEKTGQVDIGSLPVPGGNNLGVLSYAKRKDGTSRIVASLLSETGNGTVYVMYRVDANDTVDTNWADLTELKYSDPNTWRPMDYFPLSDGTGRLLWGTPDNISIRFDLQTVDDNGVGTGQLATTPKVPFNPASFSIDTSGVMRIAFGQNNSRTIWLCTYASEADLTTFPTVTGWGPGQCMNYDLSKESTAWYYVTHAIVMPW